MATQHWLMQLGYPGRRIELARAAVTRFDARVRRGIDESGGSLGVFAARLPHDYPLLPEADLESIISIIETAEELGLTVRGWLTPAAEALLRGDESNALALAMRDIPTPAAGVYVQPDLSIIAVSYTHLDVYKRQPKGSGRLSLSSPISGFLLALRC